MNIFPLAIAAAELLLFGVLDAGTAQIIGEPWPGYAQLPYSPDFGGNACPIRCYLNFKKRPRLRCKAKTLKRGVHHLSHAFQLFSEETSRLKEDYAKLQQRLQTVNQELAAAHRNLLQKVSELNCVTHYLNNILQNISQGIIFIDLEGRITTFNDAAARLLNVASKNVLYQSCVEPFS